MTSQEINEQRLGLVAQMRAMHDKLAAEGRKTFNAEEQEKYNRMRDDEKDLLAQRDSIIHLEGVEKELGTPTRQGARPGLGAENGAPIITAHMKRAGITAASLKGPRASLDYISAFNDYGRHGDASLPKDVRATLTKSVMQDAGYLVPIEYETKVVLKMYDANLMRQLGTVTRTTSQVNIPMEGNLPTFGWIGELGNYPAVDLSVGQNVLGANKLGGIITVSEEFFEDSFIDVGDYIAGRAGLAAGFGEEGAFIGGDGNQKPTGWVTTATASGTTSGQVTSQANSAITSVDMNNLLYKVPRPYRKNGSYIVADTVVQSLRNERATTGQYLWQASLTADAPDTYNGKPIYTSDFLAALAPGSVSAAFGDWSFYQIVDRVGWAMQRLNELYAANGQIGFKMSERTDGKLLRPEAVAVLTTHA